MLMYMLDWSNKVNFPPSSNLNVTIAKYCIHNTCRKDNFPHSKSFVEVTLPNINYDPRPRAKKGQTTRLVSTSLWASVIKSSNFISSKMTTFSDNWNNVFDHTWALLLFQFYFVYHFNRPKVPSNAIKHNHFSKTDFHEVTNTHWNTLW